MQGAPKNWDRVLFGIRYFDMALIGKVLHFDFRSFEFSQYHFCMIFFGQDFVSIFGDKKLLFLIKKNITYFL